MLYTDVAKTHGVSDNTIIVVSSIVMLITAKKNNIEPEASKEVISRA